MSENNCCSFCEQLSSVANPRRGRASKCPVCKQALWESDGGTYRLIDSAAPARGSGVWLLAAGSVVTLALCVAAAAILLMPRDRKVRETLAQIDIPTAPIAAASRAVKVKAPRPVQQLPLVQVKVGGPDEGVCAKPPPPVVDTKAVVKPSELAYGEQPAAVKPPVRQLPPGVCLTIFLQKEEQLEKLLRETPHVDLDPDYANKSKKDLTEAAKKIVADTKDDADAFVRGLKKTRPDLAGLPFLMGKDCTLSKNEAKALANDALAIRTRLDDTLLARSRSSQSYASNITETYGPDDAAHRFWNHSGKPTGIALSATPALKQIMMAENASHRQHFVASLRHTSPVVATKPLVDFAVFDLNPDVRKLAIQFLYARPSAEYRSMLLNALRYPWTPAARHAADAIVKLNLQDAVPDLLHMLDEPDPRAPFVVKKDGEKAKTMVRELVSVNHHRNCMLCHVPIAELPREMTRVSIPAFPMGPVTSQQDPLPRGSGAVYYGLEPGITVVRADVTYLRQDFSVKLKVEKSGKWPQMQRFDFFVRTVELNEKEAAARKSAPGLSEFHATVLSALYGLTGHTHGVTVEGFRDVPPESLPGVAKRGGKR